MKKITILMDTETEKKFQYILSMYGERLNWQLLPTYKEVIIAAIDLLYKKEKRANITKIHSIPLTKENLYEKD